MRLTDGTALLQILFARRGRGVFDSRSKSFPAVPIVRRTITRPVRDVARALATAFALVGTTAWAAAQPWVPPERDPRAPAAQQLEARMARIDQEVNRLTDAGLASDAEAMRGQLDHFRGELDRIVKSWVDAPELDVIGIDGPANASVEITATDRPLVLALASYSGVNWSLSVSPDANVQKVLVSSYDEGIRPKGLPTSIPVQYYGPANPPFFLATDKDYDTFPRLAVELKNITNLPITTFQGRHSGDNLRFSVGDIGPEYNAQRVLAEMVPLYEKAISFQLGRDLAAAAPYLAQVRPSTFIAGRDFAIDPRGPVSYAADRSTVYRISPDGGETTIAGYEWIGGITFDTKRNRLVGASQLMGGSFFTYQPDQNRWSTTAPPNGSVHSITYSATDDAIYGLADDSDGLFDLVKYDASLRLVTSTPLAERFMFAPTIGSTEYRLIAAADRLVLVTPPVPDMDHPELPPRPVWYLIDPGSGAVTYLGAVPEPSAAALGLAPLAVITFSRRRAGASQ